MNEITIFENPEFGKVRTLQISGEPWFVGKDVCEIFGDKNHNRSIGRVDTVDKRHERITDSLGREQKAVFVNESGLYSLLFAMQPQKANNNGVSDAYPIEVQERIEKLHKFKHWVTSEVLPAIRKTGSYSITDNSYSNADMALLKIVKAGTAEERALAVSEYHEIVVKPLEDKIEKQKPLVEVAEKRISNKGCYSITDITKSLNLKRGYITRWAKAKGYLHQSLNEVNKAGEKFFKVYSTDFIHNSIGITEEGLQFIKNHIAEIYDLNSTEKF